MPEEENRWVAPKHEVESADETLFRDTSSGAFSGSVRAAVRGVLDEPWLALPSLALFFAHLSAAIGFWLGHAAPGGPGIWIFVYVWFVMPTVVVAADLWASHDWLHYFRTGERPAGADRWPAPRSLRLAFPLTVVSIPWSFFVLFVFLTTVNAGVDFPRTTIVAVYAILRWVHFFHGPLYADRPLEGFGQYVQAIRALGASPIRVFALGLLYIAPTLLLDYFVDVPAIRIVSFLVCVPVGILVPAISAFAFNKMAYPGEVGPMGRGAGQSVDSDEFCS
jgi:hypothetical protein